MSVKEVLQSLVDDGLVDTDRVGTSNYFWSFPSKAVHKVSGHPCLWQFACKYMYYGEAVRKWECLKL